MTILAKLEPLMRLGSRLRIDPFALALGLFVGVLAFGALSVGASPERALPIAGIVGVGGWIVLDRVPGVLERTLDRRAYVLFGFGPIVAGFGVVAVHPSGVQSRLPFWIALIVAGVAVLITGQRRHAKLLRERNRVHHRVFGRRSKWTSLLWTMGGSAIGILGVTIATVGPHPVGGLLRQLTPVFVGSAIGTLVGFLIVDRPNTVELLVLDDALVVDARGTWGTHPIDWRRVRTFDLEDDTLHVRTVLWSASFHCDLADVERPREVAQAFRDRIEAR
jgi:hypothetical protein